MILIPFSSGLDSTTLIHQALEKKERFCICYIGIKNNENKTKIETLQRKKILSLFNEKYNTYINDSSLTEVHVCGNNMIILPQVPAWIMGLLYSIDTGVKEIRLGYCMNDDAVSFVSDIKKIWKSYQALSEYKLPKITFPLLKKRKADYHSNLPNNVFQETFFCENPTITGMSNDGEEEWEDCRYCGSCKRAIYDGTFDYYKRNQKNNVDFPSNSEDCDKFAIEGSGLEPMGSFKLEGKNHPEIKKFFDGKSLAKKTLTKESLTKSKIKKTCKG